MRTTFIFIFLSFATLQGIHGDFRYVEEWMPISNEEIIRRLNSNIPKLEDVKQNDLSWYQIVDLTTENPDVIRYEAIKLVEPQKLHGKFEVKRFGLPTKTNDTKDHINQGKLETSADQNLRKGKKLKERNLIEVYHNDLMTKEKADSTKDYNVIEDASEKGNIENYEVTESSAATIQVLNPIESKPGYVYSAPTKPEQPQSNYIETFQSILGKYNINSQDKLANYAKSRIPNQYSQNQQIIYLPTPIRYSQRYNNLNHRSIDNLIAVFLSNYGHYLPYSYGLHKYYNNLFGYLASNNIHNNNRFEPYKIFSDTDSFN